MAATMALGACAPYQGDAPAPQVRTRAEPRPLPYAGIPRAPSEAEGLKVTARSTKPVYADGERVDLVARFSNVGTDTLVVLPVACGLRIEGDGAVPGPFIASAAIPIWAYARAVKPGQSTEWTFRGLLVRYHGWHLKPGDYEISVRYEVAWQSINDEVRRALPEGRVWTGVIESAPVSVRVVPTAWVGE
jgi:hypothetical protein